MVKSAGVSTSTTSTSPPSSSVHGRLAVSELDLRDDGDAREIEELRERGPSGCLHRVSRLHTGEDEVGRLGTNHLRQRARDLNRVELFVGINPDPAIRAHGETASHRVLGVLVPHGDDHDLAFASGLAQAQRLLSRVRIPLVEGVVEVVGIDVPFVVGELDFVA